MTTKRQCAVPDCQNDSYVRGWCVRHYKAFQKYGDPLGHAQPKPRPLCAIKGCKTFARPRGLCASHEGRLRRHGNPTAGQIRGKKGSDAVGYFAMHCRLRKLRGKASEHFCLEPDCGHRATDWALNDIANPKIEKRANGRGLRYSVSVNDYSPKCRAHNISGDYAYNKGDATVFVECVRSIASVEGSTLAA